MPQVKLYKNGNEMMPVEGTVVRNGYRCSRTGKLFLNKASYVAHLRKVRTNIRSKIRTSKIDEEFAKFWKLTSIEDIAAWIEANSDLIFERCEHAMYKGMDSQKVRNKFKVRLSHLYVYHSPTVSNSHSAPHGKCTNWGREPGKPFSYPGWNGNVEFEIIPECGIGGSDVGDALRMNTGSGGSDGKGHYGYSVKLFEDDWPGLCEHVVMSKLTDDRSADFLFGKPKFPLQQSIF